MIIIQKVFSGILELCTNNQFWWVIGVRKGIVSGQTDRYFDNRNDAESVAVSVQDSLGVPEMKSFPKDDSQNHLLSRIGRPKKTLMGDPTALTYLKDTALIKLAKAAAIAIGLGIGWWSVDAILDYRATQEALEQARILTQNKEKRARELAEHPEKYFQSGWMTAPEADAFITQPVRPGNVSFSDGGQRLAADGAFLLGKFPVVNMGADGALRLHAPAVQRRIGFQKAQIRPVQQEAARSFQRRAKHSHAHDTG